MWKINKLTKNIIISDYSYLKKKATTLYDIGNYEDSLSYIKVAAKIAYHLNFQYTDDDLENLLKLISSKLVKSENIKCYEEKYVFFDSFGFDNRGLTEQYLKALISWNIKFKYILESDINLSFSKNIIEILKEYSNCEIIIIPSNLTEIEKIKYLAQLIDKYRPTKAFLHLSPWSVVGVCAFISCSSITRYLINLTDHAFWIGKSCVDYLIEFRNYGYNISKKFRGIPAKKLLFQPYYPIQRNSKFDGFPVNTTNKVIVFTGGAFYKMYGKKGKFFDLIKKILDNNQNIIFLIAGSGKIKPFNTFIKKYNYSKRMFLLGNRNDINEVFKNIDIYLATYPLTGGLMAQYAALHNKNIIAYSTEDLPFNFIEDIVNVSNSIQLTFTEEEEFHKEINHLIQDKQYRESKFEFLSQSILTEQQFNTSLHRLIQENISNKFNNIEISTEKFFQLYLETENDFLHKYYTIIYSSIKQKIFKNTLLSIRFIMDLFINRKLEFFNYLLKK